MNAKNLLPLIQAKLRGMLKISPLPMNIRPKGIDNIWTFVSREGIAGDYLEFGVYSGQSFIEAYRSAQWIADRERGRERKERAIRVLTNLANIRFFAFDSFTGLPHSDADNRFRKGELACSMEQFSSNLRLANIGD